MALSNATTENKKLKNSQERLESKMTRLSNENQELKDRNSNSIMILSDLQTENDELKETLSHASPKLFEVKRQKVKFDDDADLSIEDLSSEEQSLPRIFQSISDLKKSLNEIDDYELQSKLLKVTGKLENLANGAIKKSKH